MTAGTPTKLTYDDYLNLPDDGRRYEIIDGELYVNPAPNIRHQPVSRNIFRRLDGWVLPRNLGEVFYAPCDVVLSEIDVLEPDILFISTARLTILTRANVKGAPDLVIEVLSEGTRRYDETTKRKRYEHFGVSEYWLADPENYSFRILRGVGGRFEEIEVGTTITTPLLPGFSLAVSEVFEE